MYDMVYPVVGSKPEIVKNPSDPPHDVGSCVALIVNVGASNTSTLSVIVFVHPFTSVNE